MLTFSLYILQSDCSLERIKYLKKFVSYPVSRTAQIIVFLDVFLILEFFFLTGEKEEKSMGNGRNGAVAEPLMQSPEASAPENSSLGRVPLRVTVPCVSTAK